MKKTLTIVISVLLLFVLSACNDSNSNTISLAQLTDRESAILSSSSDIAFVFDFNIDKENKEGNVWVEKYEFGNLVNDKIANLTTQVEGNGSIIFTTSRTNHIQKQPTFNIAISGKDGLSSINAFDPDSNGIDNMAVMSANFPGESISIEGEVVLASICYSNDGSMSSLTADFYQDVDGHINELEEYDIVYLFKADLIN